MTIDTKIVKILVKINFAQRFKKIVDAHSDYENRLNKVDKKRVFSIFELLGYKIHFTDNVFTFVEEIKNIKIHFILSLKNGIFDIMSAITVDENYLEIRSGSFVILAREEKGETFEIKCPNFVSFEELEQILVEIMPLYEDFKDEVLKEFSQ
jgi:hypothetical protein